MSCKGVNKQSRVIKKLPWQGRGKKKQWLYKKKEIKSLPLALRDFIAQYCSLPSALSQCSRYRCSVVGFGNLRAASKPMDNGRGIAGSKP